MGCSQGKKKKVNEQKIMGAESTKKTPATPINDSGWVYNRERYTEKKY
jgi:hypothetical protein